MREKTEKEKTSNTIFSLHNPYYNANFHNPYSRYFQLFEKKVEKQSNISIKYSFGT